MPPRARGLPGLPPTPEEDATMDDHQKDMWAGVVLVGMILTLLLGGLLVLWLQGL